MADDIAGARKQVEILRSLGASCYGPDGMISCMAAVADMREQADGFTSEETIEWAWRDIQGAMSRFRDYPAGRDLLDELATRLAAIRERRKKERAERFRATLAASREAERERSTLAEADAKAREALRLAINRGERSDAYNQISRVRRLKDVDRTLREFENAAPADKERSLTSLRRLIAGPQSMPAVDKAEGEMFLGSAKASEAVGDYDGAITSYGRAASLLGRSLQADTERCREKKERPLKARHGELMKKAKAAKTSAEKLQILEAGKGALADSKYAKPIDRLIRKAQAKVAAEAKKPR